MKYAKCHPTRKLKCREMCGSCYDKWLKSNSPPCSTEGCEYPVHAKTLCRNCYDKKLKKENSEYKENQKNNHIKWKKNNYDKWVKNEEKQKLNRRLSVHTADIEDDKQRRSKAYSHKYGINIEEYERMLIAQNYSCAICQEKQENIPYKLHVDHCHTTGAIRGLLCQSCNLGLGYIEKTMIKIGFNEILKYLELQKLCQKKNKVVKSLIRANRE